MSGSLPPTAFSFTSPHLRENLQSLPLHNVCLLDTCKCFLCWYVSFVIYLRWITRCSACPNVMKCQNPPPPVTSAAWILSWQIRYRKSHSHGRENNWVLRTVRISHTDSALALMPWWRIACLQMTWHEHFTFTVAATLGQWTCNIVRWEFWWDLTSEIPLVYWNMFLLYLFWSFLWLGSPSLDFCSCHYGMLECA